MSQTTTPHPLLSLLESQRRDAARMAEILKEELQAIKDHDLAAFENCMDVKARHMAHLEQQERDFQPMLQQIIGVPADKERVAAYIASSGNAALQQAWDKLRETLKQCYEQNLLNQRIIEASRAEVQQALNVLRGEQAMPQTGGIYQDTGKTDSSPAKGQSIGVV